MIISRNRKVRCDSGRPQCRNCSRRSENCEYDVAPKRRGPDRQPGTRHRMFQKKPEGYVPPKRVRRNKDRDELSTELDRAMPPAVRNSANKRGSIDGGASNASSSAHSLPHSSRYPAAVEDSNPLIKLSNVALQDAELDAAMKAAGFLSLMALYQSSARQHAVISSEHDHLNNLPISDGQFTNNDFSLSPFGQLVRRRAGSQRRIVRTSDGESIQILNDPSYIPRGPSVNFSKQIWWENLLQLYSDDPSLSAVKIYQDISFL